VVRVGQERNMYKVLVGKREGKKPLGRPKRRWEDRMRSEWILGILGGGS
jgi:hypothetical protein